MTVVNLLPTIAPKSDQLNADDLIGRSMTIRVTKVGLCGEADQPIAVHFDGDGGKPYKPCKSMRRVMVHIWGSDGAKYVGQRMTLYRDDRVQFGGLAVGGIRISHMTGIDRDVTLALTATRANRKPFTVRPLAPEPGDATANDPVDVDAILKDGRNAAARGTAALNSWWTALSKAEKVAAKPTLDSELKASAAKADQAVFDDDLSSAEDTMTPSEPFDPLEWATLVNSALEGDDFATVAKLDAFTEDHGNLERFKALEETSPGIAKSLNAAINGRRKALASKEAAS
jgi:hypothetical protein